MRRYVFRLAILSLAVLMPSVARAVDPAAIDRAGNDQAIAQQIVQQLQAEKKGGGLKGFSIDLSVEEGTVWLSGRVANAGQQAKALEIARRVPGVRQVVNDLDIAAPPTALATAPATTPRNAFANMTNAVQKAMGRQISREPAAPIDSDLQQAAGEEFGAIGSGIERAAGRPVVESAQPVAAIPNYYSSPTAQPVFAQQPAYAAQPSAQPAFAQQLAAQPTYAPQAAYAAQPAYATPVYAGSRSQVPLAFAPAQHASYDGQVAADGYAAGGPVAMHLPGSGVGIAPARYDHPHMPGYAWPSYASYPNYAAVTYPKQYSPTAWPYIGPFYPYPQVPLGWRKVTLEWDDGWWMLDFKDRRTMYNH